MIKKILYTLLIILSLIGLYNIPVGSQSKDIKTNPFFAQMSKNRGYGHQQKNSSTKEQTLGSLSKESLLKLFEVYPKK